MIAMAETKSHEAELSGMTEGVSSASLIAAAFGPGAVRRARPVLGPAYAREPAALQPAPPTEQTRLEDRVEITGATGPPPESNSPAAAYDAYGWPTAIPTDTQDPSSGTRNSAETVFTDEETQQVEDLKQGDSEVRRHEQAHISAGGQYVRGGARLEYETGPDGQRYATAGEVSIDTAEVANDPAATIRKMQAVRRAALAPAEPSATDRRIAAEAQAKANQARRDMQEKTGDEAPGQIDTGTHKLPGDAESGMGPAPRSAEGEPNTASRNEKSAGVKTLIERSTDGPANDREENAASSRVNRDTDVPRIRPPSPRYSSLDGTGGAVDMVA